MAVPFGEKSNSKSNNSGDKNSREGKSEHKDEPQSSKKTKLSQIIDE